MLVGGKEKNKIVKSVLNPLSYKLSHARKHRRPQGIFSTFPIFPSPSGCSGGIPIGPTGGIPIGPTGGINSTWSLVFLSFSYSLTTIPSLWLCILSSSISYSLTAIPSLWFCILSSSISHSLTAIPSLWLCTLSSSIVSCLWQLAYLPSQLQWLYAGLILF